MKSVPVVVGDLVYVSGFNTPENDPGKQVSLPTWQELLARDLPALNDSLKTKGQQPISPPAAKINANDNAVGSGDVVTNLLNSFRSDDRFVIVTKCTIKMPS